MNILASYRYQMLDFKKSILCYYLIFIGVLIILPLAAYLTAPEHTYVSFNGLDFVSLIFLFVMGLCTFKENFLLLLQNGISRKTFFAGKILTFLSAALIISVFDKVIFGLLTLFSHVVPWIQAPMLAIRASWPNPDITDFSSEITAGALAVDFISEFFSALFMLAVGGFITVLFYRLNKTGKVAVSIGVPALCAIILPLIDLYITHGALSSLLEAISTWISESEFHSILSDFVTFLIFSLLTFLLLRRMPVKKQ